MIFVLPTVPPRVTAKESEQFVQVALPLLWYMVYVVVALAFATEGESEQFVQVALPLLWYMVYVVVALDLAKTVVVVNIHKLSISIFMVCLLSYW